MSIPVGTIAMPAGIVMTAARSVQGAATRIAFALAGPLPLLGAESATRGDIAGHGARDGMVQTLWSQTDGFRNDGAGSVTLGLCPWARRTSRPRPIPRTGAQHGDKHRGKENPDA